MVINIKLSEEQAKMLDEFLGDFAFDTKMFQMAQAIGYQIDFAMRKKERESKRVNATN